MFLSWLKSVFQRSPAVWTIWVGSVKRNHRIASSCLKADGGRIGAAWASAVDRDGGENISSKSFSLVARIRELSSFFPLNVYTHENFSSPLRKQFFFKRKIRALTLCSVYSTAKKYCRWKSAPRYKAVHFKADSVFCGHSSCKLFVK